MKSFESFLCCSVVKVSIKYNMLSTVVAQLEQLIVQIKASGSVADAEARLDILTHSKSSQAMSMLACVTAVS